jgi:plasmid stabilization system protein ParE
VVKEILKATKEISYPEQYQFDEVNPNYRRIIVWDYKILYNFKSERIVIFKIFSARQNPEILRDFIE